MSYQPPEGNKILPLRNVGLLVQSIEKALHRPYGAAGMICFSGRSGVGKSTAAIRASVEYRAYCIEMASYWTYKMFAEKLAEEVGIVPKRTAGVTIDAVIEQLIKAQPVRPLIIDEMDKLMKKSWGADLIHDIYQKIADSNGTIVMIGEERLKDKIESGTSETFVGRVLDWPEAKGPDLADARRLRDQYCTKVTLHDDVLEPILIASRGSIRRYVVNLILAQDWAVNRGLSKASLSDFDGVVWDDGRPPARRSR